MPFDTSNLTASANVTLGAYSGLSLNIVAALGMALICLFVVSLATKRYFDKWLALCGRLRGVARSFIIGVPTTLAIIYSYRGLAYMFNEAADYGITWLDVAKVVGALGAVTIVGYCADKVFSGINRNIERRLADNHG